MGGGSNRSALFPGKGCPSLAFYPTEPQPFAHSATGTCRRGELDPNQRLGKDQLSRISQKYIQHFSNPEEKTTFNVFSQNPWFLGRLLPLVKNFSTRRLIDLQANLITAFEQVLAQPKEQHANIFKTWRSRPIPKIKSFK